MKAGMHSVQGLGTRLIDVSPTADKEKKKGKDAEERWGRAELGQVMMLLQKGRGQSK